MDSAAPYIADIPCGLFCIGPDGAILQANAVFADWLKYAPEELLSMKWTDLLTMGGKIYNQTHFMPLLSMGKWVEEVYFDFKQKDGNKVMAYINAKEVTILGSSARYCVSVFRSTQRARYEAELLQSKRALEESVEQLHAAQGQLLQSSKMATIGQMVGGVAHEINNPLNFVHGALGVLDSLLPELLDFVAATRQAVEEKTPDDAVAAIRQIIRETDVMQINTDAKSMLDSARQGTSRIADIVRALRLSASESYAEMQALDIHETLDAALSVLKSKLLNFSVVKNYASLPMIMGRTSELVQLFMNVLLNAADYTPKGGTIAITTRKQGNFIAIDISDSGPGIPQEVIDKVFDPFFTTKAVGQGLGLGLSIARGIVLAHKGQIQVNASEKGTVVSIFLPLG